jgi:hypothetical protein
MCARDDPAFALHAFLNETLRAQAKDPGRAHEIAVAGIAGLRKELSKERLDNRQKSLSPR